MPRPVPTPDTLRSRQAVECPAPAWLTVQRVDPETGRLAAPPSQAEEIAFGRFLRTQPDGRAAWRHAPYAQWMIDVVLERAEWLLSSAVRPLRAFALACAFGGDVPLREVVGAPAIAFDAAAVTRGESAALAQLAVFHAADEDACRAALWSSEFAARRRAVVVLRDRAADWSCSDPQHRGLDRAWHFAHFVHHHPQAFEAALLQARARQALRLRALLPDPFGEPCEETHVRVYFGQSPPALGLFCTACAAGLAGMQPGGLFDGRWYRCAGCQAKLLTRFPREET